MIEIKFNEKTINSLSKKLNMIANRLVENVVQGMNEVMSSAQEEALSKKIGSKDKSKISYEIEEENKTIIGTLKTNMPLKEETYKSYAPMIEFGTGRFGELEKLGKTKTFVESGYSYWYLPVEKASRDFGSHRKIIIDGKEFYIMYSQPPNPFMRPTGTYLRDNASKMLKERLKNDLRIK